MAGRESSRVLADLPIDMVHRTTTVGGLQPTVAAP